MKYIYPKKNMQKSISLFVKVINPANYSCIISYNHKEEQIVEFYQTSIFYIDNFLMSGNCEENSDEMKQLKLNYKYLLALVDSFSAKYNDARMEDYIKLSNGLVPSSICENARDIKKMNLSEIINPLLSENNNVLEKN